MQFWGGLAGDVCVGGDGFFRFWSTSWLVRLHVNVINTLVLAPTHNGNQIFGVSLHSGPVENPYFYSAVI